MKRAKCLILILTLFLFSCGNGEGAGEQNYTKGQTKILVDESFAPIIEDQAYVFENIYPKAKFDLVYKPENELLKIFLDDSIQVAIMSRNLTSREAKVYENQKIKIRVNRFAIDGIALITHQSKADSSVLVSDIINVMRGNPSAIKNLVFDNPNSSTVRYLMELAKIKTLPAKGVYALKSNPDVIRYIYNNPGTIGVVGINWIVQPGTGLEKFVADLKVLGVKNLPGKPGDDGFYKPTQNDLAQELYPLTRNLYIINCQGGVGLGSGFASFLAGEQGQRIVLKSGLLPDSIPSREVTISNELNLN